MRAKNLVILPSLLHSRMQQKKNYFLYDTVCDKHTSNARTGANVIGYVDTPQQVIA